MKRAHTSAFKQFSLIVLFCFASLLSRAVCTADAHFSYTNPAGDSAVFTPVDTNSSFQFAWLFGDGTSDSSNINPSHVYAAGGTYHVIHVVYNLATFCYDSTSLNIVVGDTCHITPLWTSVLLGGDSVRFSAADTNSAATHVWKFSDGGFDFGVTQTVHHFATPGVYTACFYVYRGACSDSLCAPITASSDTCGLLATWSYSGAGTDSIIFTPSNTDTAVIHNWSFGDGSYALGVIDTSHVYASAGFYTVGLFLHLPGTNCYDTLYQSVAVGANPCATTASWTYYTHGGDSAQFTAADTNRLAQYQWTFGDGGFATGVRNTSHTYAAPGTYTVCFYVTIPGTVCSDSFCQSVTVHSDTCGLTASWHAVNLGGDSLRFIADDTSSVAIHTWNFGDGTTATGSTDTVHTFPATGLYTVCFYTHIPGTGCYDSICQQVQAGAPVCPVVATWTAYQLGPDSVRFVADDTVSNATHVWNFGDGTFAYTGTTTHTYASAGSYHVCFYASILGTSCSDSSCNTVVVSSDTCHIVSNWSYNALGGDSVTFTAADANATNHHVWNFGDGSATVDTLRTNHLFPTSGNYHVCMNILSADSGCNLTLCQDVTVDSILPCHITAAWTSAIAGNDSIHFIASDTNHLATHVWHFGDGTTASGTTNTIHQYAAPGTYTACFYTTLGTCIDSLCQSVVVTGSAPCHITAAWTSTVGAGDSIQFAASDTNHLAQYIWHFGDGTTGSGKNVSHHYATSGTYTVCFSANIPGTNCGDTICQQITVVNATCHINTAWTYTLIGTDSIQVTASDTNSTAIHKWSFGDGTVVTGTNSTIHHYAIRGNYTICYVVYIPSEGCADSLCQSVAVGSPCNITAAWTYNVTLDSLSCTATDTNRLADHLWTLNGNAVVSGTHLDLQFLAGGTFNICLYVSITGTNCVDSFCQTVVISGINGLNTDQPAVSVIPNPFSQYTVVKVEGDVQPYDMNVYDLMGKMIRHETSTSNVFTFERNGLASGMYIYEVQLHGATVHNGKLILE